MAQVPLVQIRLNARTTPTFTGININLADLATVLQQFVVQGSQRYNLTKAELNIFVKDGEDPDADYSGENLDWFFERGNALFDTLIYQASRQGIRVQAKADAARPPPRSGDDVARALFVQYFFILTRGTYSTSITNQVGSDMPNFLINILGANLSPMDYAELLATFPILHLDARWVEHINFNAMDQAALSRFGLGVAGDRCFAPFKYLPRPPKATPNGIGSTPQLIMAYEVAMSFVNAAPNWDRHPTTRSPTLLAQYGSLNHNATNLAIELWCNDDNTGPNQAMWQPLVNHKMIYAMPTANVRHQEWKNWNVPYVPNAGRQIQFV